MKKQINICHSCSRVSLDGGETWRKEGNIILQARMEGDLRPLEGVVCPICQEGKQPQDWLRFGKAQPTGLNS